MLARAWSVPLRCFGAPPRPQRHVSLCGSRGARSCRIFRPRTSACRPQAPGGVDRVAAATAPVPAPGPAAVAPSGYRPRAPEGGVIHRVVREHLETFLAEARRRSHGAGLPPFVERELRDFLACGQLAAGFVRLRCEDCRKDLLVPFSCKGRGFCPSCTGRRMASLAAHLADEVLAGLPVRQWVLTCPHRLRYAMAWDHRLCRAVLAVFVRALLGFERRRARRRGVPGGLGGAVTAIQRFGSAANLNVHFHTLAVQGVFANDGSGGVRFLPLPAPSDREVERLLVVVRRRIVRLARRHGIDLDGDGGVEVDRIDALADESPVLAGMAGASVAGRAALGAEAGRAPARLGREHEAPFAERPLGPCHARQGGFDLHAAVAVPAGGQVRLEHLCRYVLRPPIAQDALALAPDGRVVLALRRPWRDGTRALVFDPLDFLARLAALTPRPRINLLIYHGVFAPHAADRRAAVTRGDRHDGDGGDGACADHDVGGSDGAGAHGAQTTRIDGDPTAVVALVGSAAAASSDPRGGEARSPDRESPPQPRGGGWIRWADLLRRVFEIDALECPRCRGRLRFVAAIDHPDVIRRILAHLGLPSELPRPLPARPPPLTPELPFGWE
jgi:Putative transposase/Transposase zinc-binding domain